MVCNYSILREIEITCMHCVCVYQPSLESGQVLQSEVQPVLALDCDLKVV